MQTKSIYYLALQLRDITDKFKTAQDKILKTDLHANGLETDLHLTLFFAISDFHVLEMSAISEFANTLLVPLTLKISKVSIFESKEFDVLKCDVENETISEINTIIRTKFAAYNIKPTFDEYKPHITLAYLRNSVIDSYDIEKFTEHLCNLELIVESIKIQKTIEVDAKVDTKTIKFLYV